MKVSYEWALRLSLEAVRKKFPELPQDMANFTLPGDVDDKSLSDWYTNRLLYLAALCFDDFATGGNHYLDTYDPQDYWSDLHKTFVETYPDHSDQFVMLAGDGTTSGKRPRPKITAETTFAEITRFVVEVTRENEEQN